MSPRTSLKRRVGFLVLGLLTLSAAQAVDTTMTVEELDSLDTEISAREESREIDTGEEPPRPDEASFQRQVAAGRTVSIVGVSTYGVGLALIGAGIIAHGSDNSSHGWQWADRSPTMSIFTLLEPNPTFKNVATGSGKILTVMGPAISLIGQKVAASAYDNMGLEYPATWKSGLLYGLGGAFTGVSLITTIFGIVADWGSGGRDNGFTVLGRVTEVASLALMGAGSARPVVCAARRPVTGVAIAPYHMGRGSAGLLLTCQL